MKNIDSFLSSKNGKVTAVVIMLLMLIVIIVVGGVNGGLLSGTAGVTYTCLPTCVENDAKMFAITGTNQQSLINLPVKVWIMISGDQPAFTIGFFDGDSGKDINNKLNLLANGKINAKNGNWDDTQTGDTTYTLYADPLADGSGLIALASWKGNEVMLNNAWWETSVNNDEQAKAPNGNYYYRLEATRPANSLGGNAFKVRASGYLIAGQSTENAVGLTGMYVTTSDLQILNSNASYNGEWTMNFNVPMDVQKIEIWDADFDSSGDTDDSNTVGSPAWAISPAVNEGIGTVVVGKVDDMPSAPYKVSPSVSYELLDPNGQSVCVNNNPSGVKEWEDFIVSSDPADNPDCLASAPLTAGMYSIRITGLDLHNFVWISVNYPICDPNGGCPPAPTE